jgi:hypothetical protein
VIAPGRQVEVKSTPHELVAIAIVDGGACQVLKSDRAPRKVLKRKMNVTLTLVPGIVDRDKPPLAIVSFP